MSDLLSGKAPTDIRLVRAHAHAAIDDLLREATTHGACATAQTTDDEDGDEDEGDEEEGEEEGGEGPGNGMDERVTDALQ